MVLRRRERLQLKQQEGLQGTLGSWRTSKRTLDKPEGGLLRRGAPLQSRQRRETSGLIIDAAAAAMDEGMETCSGDILGDEEEVKVSPRSCVSELTYSARFINCGFDSNSCQRGI